MPSVKAIKKYNNYGYAKCEGYTCPVQVIIMHLSLS